MTLDLPRPVAAYFVADRADGEAVSRCFTDNAVVKDEGHAYHGVAAIKQWKSAAAAKFRYACEPSAVEQNDEKVTVTGRLTGNFPGSPVNLRYCFVLEGDKIASLEIIP